MAGKYSIDTKKYKNKMVSSCARAGVKLNLTDPKTIQDKLCYLNIYDTNPLKVKCADKILVHDYCKKKLGEDICIPLIATYDKAEEIKWDELPEKFVLKCNHGSGMNIIVRDKKKLDKALAVSKLNRWLKEDFTFKNGFEAHYHDIKRRILVEEYKEDGHKQLLDYKFLCFNGVPKYVLVIGGRGSGPLDIQYYDMDFKKQTIRKKKTKKGEPSQKKPKSFELMKEYAKKLSEDFKFVRVDFYEIDGEPYLGELTFTPKAMHFRYENPKDEIMMGNLLDISDLVKKESERAKKAAQKKMNAIPKKGKRTPLSFYI